jgi:hypothetical protein
MLETVLETRKAQEMNNFLAFPSMAHQVHAHFRERIVQSPMIYKAKQKQDKHSIWGGTALPQMTFEKE